MGYFPLSFFKKTRYTAIWGMVASSSGIVFWLVLLARYVLLGYDWQVSGLRADSFTKDIAFFVVVEHVAFCASILLLRRVVRKSAFMRGICLTGTLGWFLSLMMNLAFILDSPREIIYQHLVQQDWYFAVYCGIWYVLDAMLLLFFVALLFNCKKVSQLMDDDDMEEEWLDNCSSERRVDWSKYLQPLLILFLIAVPLGVTTFNMTCPHFSKSLVFVDFRVNVLAFKLLCGFIVAVMAITSLRALWPFWDRLFRFAREVLGNIRKNVSGMKQTPHALRSENVSTRKRLLEIRQLLDDGLITQAEYEQKRADILKEV